MQREGEGCDGTQVETAPNMDLPGTLSDDTEQPTMLATTGSEAKKYPQNPCRAHTAHKRWKDKHSLLLQGTSESFETYQKY
jgi:hypothetical protein